MSAWSDAPGLSAGGPLREFAKLSAFLRRDFLTALTYRAYLFSDLANLFLQAGLFYFVGRLVDPAEMPRYDSSTTTYLEFVAIGLVLTAFVQLLTFRVGYAIRQEQLYGTLESLLMTPTAYSTVLVGSIAYDLAYLPLRTALFLLVLIATGGIDLAPEGLVPAAVIVLLFVPFAWGLGAVAAAATIVFRRGTGGVGFATTVLAIVSGAYFPLSVLPDRVAGVAELNPIALALEGTRSALLGGASWASVADRALPLAVASLAALALGVMAFHLAMRRERQRGTLGFY
jgi:ABC-2 type transport system permease protein